MKTIPLRTLVRDPIKVKAMTKKGQPVTVTDKGIPLWVLTPAQEAPVIDEEERARAIDEILEEARREKIIKCTATDIIKMWR
jgi:antitoxin (DNA-binding transcriptional repressor) of toxin-antitoxin stability system